MEAPSEKLKIGICGGGIAGLCLLYGLLQYPRLDVTLYEASAEILGDEGSGIVVSPNALRALALIGEPLVTAIENADSVSVSDPFARLMMAHGPHYGEKIVDIRSNSGETGYLVQRSKFIQQLFKVVPAERCKTGKKLSSVETNPADSSVAVQFTDASSESMDVLIGGDGIHSMVRQHVLADNPQQVSAVRTNAYMYLNMVPMDHGRERLDHRDLLDSIQYGHIADRGFLIHDSVNSKQTLQVIATIHTNEPWEESLWMKQKSEAEMREDLRRFGSVGDACADLLANDGKPLTARSIWEHPLTSIYNRDHVALLGDAAHSMQPWQAAGAGQAIEDAMVLCKVFALVKAAEDIPAVLEAYTKARRERTQFAQETSARTGKIMVGLDPDVGLDLGKLREYFEGRWEKLWYFDLDKHYKDALGEAKTAIERLRSSP